MLVVPSTQTPVMKWSVLLIPAVPTLGISREEGNSRHKAMGKQ